MHTSHLHRSLAPNEHATLSHTQRAERATWQAEIERGLREQNPATKQYFHWTRRWLWTRAGRVASSKGRPARLLT